MIDEGDHIARPPPDVELHRLAIGGVKVVDLGGDEIGHTDATIEDERARRFLLLMRVKDSDPDVIKDGTGSDDGGLGRGTSDEKSEGSRRHYSQC